MAQFKRKFSPKSKEEKEKEVKKIVESIDNRVKEVFHSKDELKEHLSYMSKFYRYSPSNTFLIWQQFEGASAVGSFKFWKDQGYQINKGEKGIKILVPNKIKPSFVNDEGKWVHKDKATEDELRQIENDDIKHHNGYVDYSIGHVFDVSQTNIPASDLPKLFPNKWLEGNVENYTLLYQGMESVAKDIGVKIVEPYEELGVAKGVSYTALKEVALNPRNSELQNVKTLIHELAHATLHALETRSKYTKPEKEFQAEMVAFTVCTHFGLDTSDYSLDYIHHYTEGKELEDHKRLLKEVRDTSFSFIQTMEQTLEKHRKQHEQQTEKVQDIASPEKRLVTKEEIDQAMKVDLVEYLQNKGESFIQQGKYYRHTEHDSLVVKDNMYSWNSKGENGYGPITFARLYYGLSFAEAVKDINQSGASFHTNRNQKAQSPKEPFSYEKIVQESDTTQHLARYLTKVRFIQPNIVQNLIQNGYVAEDERKNIVFKWKSIEGDIVGCDRQGTIPLNNPNYKHDTFKKIETHSKENYGFNVTLGTPKKLYFFESPIDLASYWSLKQQELKNCRLISMNGLKHEIVGSFIQEQVKMKQPIEKIVLCVDNDDGGRGFIEKMRMLLDNNRLMEDVPKGCKDWNDVLKKTGSKERQFELSR